MSIKIYRAYKVREPRLAWQTIWDIRDRGEAAAREALSDHYWKLIGDMSLEEDPKPTLLERLGEARRLVRSGYAESLFKPYQDEYSLDVTLAIYPYDDGYLLRAFYEPASIFRNVLDFLNAMPELTDFHYQNQSHPQPAHISDEDWERRRITWEYVAKKHRDIGNHVNLDIVSWNNFVFIDPTGLYEKWQQEGRELPSPEKVWGERLRKLEAFESAWYEPGLIRLNPGDVTIERFGPASWRCGKWRVFTSDASKDAKVFDTLNEAASHVEFEFQPEDIKRMALRLMEQHK